MYPSISKCNAKRCRCCKHICCKITIKSNVNGRQFSVVIYSDQLMLFMFYLEKRRIVTHNVLVILTYISRLPDFDIYSLLDIRKRNK